MSENENNDQVDSFLYLSRVLTGEPRIERDLAEQYVRRIRNAFGGDRLEQLLSQFNALTGDCQQLLDQVEIRIMRNSNLGIVAREIIMLWYMSRFRAPEDENGKRNELGPETPEQYFRGLLWPTIRAHPLGLSGGYFGYWKYPPEN